jgi:hypothetical protein
MFNSKKPDLFPNQPERPPGTTCPWGKPSCKGCMLWVGQHIEDIKTGEPRVEYRCAPAWAAINGTALAVRLEGIQKTTADVGKRFDAFRQNFQKLVVGIASMLPPPTAKRLNAIEAHVEEPGAKE